MIYATCYVNYNNPEIGTAARSVLARNGVETEVVYPGCCGMPKLEHGDLPKVADYARRVAAELGQWIAKEYDAANNPKTPEDQFNEYVRDVLDASCGDCHKPGGQGPAWLDTTPAGHYAKITGQYPQYITATYQQSTLYSRATTPHEGSNALPAADATYLGQWIEAQYTYQNQ